jgi:hypothetical protein
MKEKLETLQDTSFFLNCCFDDQVRTRAEIVLASQRKPATLLQNQGGQREKSLTMKLRL